MAYLLLFVAAGAWLARERTTSWNETLWIAIYPINGDGSEIATNYIAGLELRQFEELDSFIKREAIRYGILMDEPVRVELGEVIQEQPPTPPADRNMMGVMFWSLKLRYWAWRKQSLQSGPEPDIRMYVVYHDPKQNPVLAHSLGLQKGLLGVVNAFASRSMAGSNNVVLTHELLHTLGAKDRYDPATTLPIYPDGYAEPNRQPLHPQDKAEIMGGRIPISQNEAVTPRSLGRVVIGPLTAAEIRWKR
ncbi:MAG: hypothetical protein OES99_06230 [Gammaproteobacteria bacterium]|nr:hypothetical protein [Gammaproteobacteria bacterium]